MSSSIGKKAVMAVSGLILFGFIVVHLLGNLQIFLGQEAVNAYAEKLEGMGAILWVARLFLLAVLIIHVVTAVILTRENRAARPIAYVDKDYVAASYASRTMFVSGILLLIYLIYHLLHFTFGIAHPEYSGFLDLEGRRDVFSMMVASFQDVYITGVYIAAIIPLATHVSHGFQSLFQTLGLDHPRWTPAVRLGSRLIGLVIFAGYCSIPLSVQLGLVKLPLGGF